MHFLPLIIHLPLYLTSQVLCVNNNLHPMLHSYTTETSKCEASPGDMWPVYAFLGSSGVGSFHIWVDLTWYPSGFLTVNRIRADQTLTTWALARRKPLVAPESNITQSLVFSLVILMVNKREFATNQAPCWSRSWSSTYSTCDGGKWHPYPLIFGKIRDGILKSWQWVDGNGIFKSWWQEAFFLPFSVLNIKLNKPL